MGAFFVGFSYIKQELNLERMDNSLKNIQSELFGNVLDKKTYTCPSNASLLPLPIAGERILLLTIFIL